jgi:hypothetical protein
VHSLRARHRAAFAFRKRRLSRLHLQASVFLDGVLSSTIALTFPKSFVSGPIDCTFGHTHTAQLAGGSASDVPAAGQQRSAALVGHADHAAASRLMRVVPLCAQLALAALFSRAASPTEMAELAQTTRSGRLLMAPQFMLGNNSSRLDRRSNVPPRLAGRNGRRIMCVVDPRCADRTQDVVLLRADMDEQTASAVAGLRGCVSLVRLQSFVESLTIGGGVELLLPALLRGTEHAATLSADAVDVRSRVRSSAVIARTCTRLLQPMSCTHPQRTRAVQCGAVRCGAVRRGAVRCDALIGALGRGLSESVCHTAQTY